jgi:hypothetical protein
MERKQDYVCSRKLLFFPCSKLYKDSFDLEEILRKRTWLENIPLMLLLTPLIHRNGRRGTRGSITPAFSLGPNLSHPVASPGRHSASSGRHIYAPADIFMSRPTYVGPGSTPAFPRPAHMFSGRIIRLRAGI